MDEKYIKFYQSFHKGFQGKKSNSLFCSSQSLWNKWIKNTKNYFKLYVMLELMRPRKHLIFMTNLNDSYKALISSTLIWILICGSIVEWYAVNYSENHQSGWQFTGMIMMAIIVIPLSLLLSQISEYFKKDIGKRVYLLVTLILVPGIYLLLWSGALAN